MSNAMIESYASIIETSRIIDRENILREIRRALEDPSDKTHVFYITAGGGFGKTRLLREVLERLKNNWVSKRIIFPRDPVDLYHIDTRSEEGLALKIATGLDKGYFQAFLETRQAFARKKYQIKGSYRDIIEQRKKMMQTFLEDYTRLYQDYDRIFVVLDTAETWMWLYEPDRFQQALALEHIDLGSSSWVITDFLPCVRKSVVLIAGRPESQRLEEDLKSLKAQNKHIEFYACPLTDFSEEESLDYFQVVAEDTKTEAPNTSHLIDSIDEDMRRTIHHLTGGLPLLLAMSLDYLANTRRVAPLFQISPADAKEQTKTIEQQKRMKKEVQKALIKGIQETSRPLDQVIRTLGWLPKGLNAEMLAWIEQGGKPSNEQVQIAEDLLGKLTKKDRRLTFIKIRPEDERVFFHDELYDLFEKIHKQYPPETEINFYESVCGYYRYAIETVQQDIARHLQDLIKRAFSASGKRGRVQVNAAEDVQLMEKQVQMQSLMVEDLYYTLRRDPVEGFRKYIRNAEEAFQSLDETFWIELRGELKRFFENPHPWWGSPTKAEVEGEIGIGWIRYTIMQMEYREALKRAENFRENCPDLFQGDPLLTYRLDVCIGQCMVYLANSKEQMKKAEDLLKTAIRALEGHKSQDPFTSWLATTTNAQAELNLGYLYRSVGLFKKAIEPYKRSMLDYREVKNEPGQANTLNNLAWAEAEVGSFSTAFDHCGDGLEMRMKLQHPSTYAVALSLNTLGLINMRDGKAAEAEQDCKRALEIFRGLEEKRGIGLACTAMAETVRRSIRQKELALEPTDSLIKRLKKAEGYAKEAVNIFEELEEPLRTVEAYLELGCVYRELARYLEGDSSRQNETFKQGCSALEKAAELARDRFEYRRYDALVNLAFLHYFAKQPGEAENLLYQQVIYQIDPHYKLLRSKDAWKSEEQVPWNWVQLGKAYTLLGRIEFDRYIESHKNEDQITASACLDNAVKQWVLALEYNSLYGQDFRDMRRTKTRIYECLNKLNVLELRRVERTAQIVKEELIIKSQPNLLFLKLVQDHCGLTVTDPIPRTQE